ncbi:hypothetical protein GCM10011487_03210 [Steroidobacter agaridevorans]|uniref:DUF4412 domain-containing protein n=1 Tax=Steroidobacter agaridevorans TaxID=2695856 RepID=A0A829Y5N7_9GAMM|nr:hypothetical protein [Steroidobacter agaridevorans]GFE78321.1 hypothetical protein GCM10011487_03210 [Steroidobacter agaridevorans]GFE89746.1 hypothetical protein GCM10011488_47000 [Steroidobacter agaridevorans]
MQSFRTIPTRALLAGALAAILSNAAQADVIITERMSISGAGMMKMANMNGTTTTSISGQRARTDSNLQFESGLMRTFARGIGDSTEIVRLDQDKMYSVNDKQKTYTETTFAETRAQMEKVSQQMQEAQAAQQRGTSGVDDSQCEWSEPKGEVIRSGEKAAIAGYQAERVTVTATQSCKDKKTGQVCDFGLVLDQWVAPDFKASEEAQAYQLAFAQKMGLATSGSRDFAERAESMFGRYQGLWGEVSNKMRDVKGYPVKLSFGLGVGGPQCQSTQEMQAGGQQPSTASPASLGEALGGAFGGMFGKKKAAPAPEAAAPPAQLPGGLFSLMGMSTELVSVSTDKVDPQSFEPPAGYKKVAAGQ